MIAMPAGAPVWPKIRSAIAVAIRWLITPALVAGLFLAIVQCRIARDNSQISARQTANVARVSAFRDSGAALDSSVAAFSDAAATGNKLDDTRSKFRTALADHAAKAMAIRDLAGEAAITDYFAKMKALQETIEGTTDATNAGAIRTALSSIVVARNAITDRLQSGG